MEPILAAIEAWPGARLLRESLVLYPLVNAAHILGLALLFGSIATLDLRLLGAFRAVPAVHLAGPLARVAAGGLVLAVFTGALLFSTRPSAYAANTAFLAKLALVALGIANALLLRRTAAWRRLAAGGEAGTRLKIAAVLSLGLWIGAILAGRWIGFLG